MEQTLTVDSGGAQRMEKIRMVASNELRRTRGPDDSSGHHSEVCIMEHMLTADTTESRITEPTPTANGKKL
jgi:hypothetical protein